MKVCQMKVTPLLRRLHDEYGVSLDFLCDHKTKCTMVEAKTKNLKESKISTKKKPKEIVKPHLED